MSSKWWPHVWEMMGLRLHVGFVTASCKEFRVSKHPKRYAIQIYNIGYTFANLKQKRKRREYRNARKAQFVRPEPGFSLYEGRTRGKRIRYTFSDEEEGASDAPGTRRSSRQSGVPTPVEPPGPTFTASGRQVRSRVRGLYGESIPKGQQNTETSNVNENPAPVAGEGDLAPSSRTRQSALSNGTAVKARPGRHIEGYNALDEMEDESDATSSGAEWDGGDDDDADDLVIDEEDEEDADMSEDESSIADEEVAVAASKPRPRSSLVVALRYQKTADPDPPTVHINADEQGPNAKILNGQQPSLASPSALNLEIAGPQPPGEELSNEKQNNLESGIQTNSIRLTSPQSRLNKEQ